MAAKSDAVKPELAWFEPLFEKFAASCSTVRAGEGYVRKARAFFTWASAAPRNVRTLAQIPPDGVRAWLEGADTAQMAQGTKNVAVSALRAFHRWAMGEALGCAEWEWPATPRPEPANKKPKKKEPEMKNEPAEIPAAPIEEAEWGQPTPPLMDRAAFMRSPSLVKTSDTPAPAAPEPAPAEELEAPPSRDARFGDPLVISGARPRSTVKRGTRVDPLEVLCPPNGFLRVARQVPGFEPELIGQYQPANLTSYGDLPDFVERMLKPAYGPKPGEPSVKFLIYRFNQYRDPVGDPHEVTVAAPHGGAGAPSMAVEQLQRQLLEGFDQFKKQTLADTEQKVSQVTAALDKAKTPDASGVPLISELRDVLKPDLRPVENMLERFSGEVVRLVASQAAAQPSQSDQNMKMLLDRLLPNTKNGLGEAPAPNRQSELRELAETVKLMRDAFGPATPAVAAGPSPETAAILATLKAIQEEIAASRDDDDLERTAAKFRAIKEIAAELGGGGGKGSGIGEFARYVPELMEFGHRALETFAPRIKLPPGKKSGEPASKGAAGEVPKPTPAKPGALPAEVQHVLAAIRDADPDKLGDGYAEEVANALFALIMALRQAGGALGQLHERILDRFKNAKIRAQIYALITDTLVALGAEEMMVKDPELADRVGLAIADNYPEIYKSIPGWGEKQLVDQDLGDDDDDDEAEKGESVVAPDPTVNPNAVIPETDPASVARIEKARAARAEREEKSRAAAVQRAAAGLGEAEVDDSEDDGDDSESDDGEE